MQLLRTPPSGGPLSCYPLFWSWGISTLPTDVWASAFHLPLDRVHAVMTILLFATLHAVLSSHGRKPALTRWLVPEDTVDVCGLMPLSAQRVQGHFPLAMRSWLGSRLTESDINPIPSPTLCLSPKAYFLAAVPVCRALLFSAGNSCPRSCQKNGVKEEP